MKKPMKVREMLLLVQLVWKLQLFQQAQRRKKW